MPYVWPVTVAEAKTDPRLRARDERILAAQGVRDLWPRLRAKVDVDQVTGCHNWTAALSRGYGVMNLSFGFGTALAHRIVYVLTHGECVPDGVDLDHLCRNTSCVNPDHLEPVTRAENARRQWVAAPREPKTHCPKGHDYAMSGRINDQGYQFCWTCKMDYQRRYRARKRCA